LKKETGSGEWGIKKENFIFGYEACLIRGCFARVSYGFRHLLIYLNLLKKI